MQMRYLRRLNKRVSILLFDPHKHVSYRLVFMMKMILSLPRCRHFCVVSYIHVFHIHVVSLRLNLDT